MGWAIFLGVIIVLAIGFAWGMSSQEDKYKVAYEQREKALKHEMATREGSVANYAEERQQEFVRLVEQTKELDAALREGMLKGRNWLASAFAEFVDTRNLEVESWLVEKPHPALSAAGHVARSSPEASRRRSTFQISRNANCLLRRILPISRRLP